VWSTTKSKFYVTSNWQRPNFRALGDAISNIDNTEEKESDESIIGDKYSTKKIKNFDFLFEKLQNRDHSLKGVNFLNENEPVGNDNSQNTHRRQETQADLLSALRNNRNKFKVRNSILDYNKQHGSIFFPLIFMKNHLTSISNSVNSHQDLRWKLKAFLDDIKVILLFVKLIS